MGIRSILTKFFQGQLSVEMPRHIVIVADGTGRTSFQSDYSLFPCNLLQHICLFASFKIQYISFVLYGLFSPNTSSDSKSKNLVTMKRVLSELLQYVEKADFLLHIAVYGLYYRSKPDNILLECLELMGSINEFTEKRSAEISPEEMDTVTLCIYISYSSLSSLHDVSMKICQENTTELVINSSVEPSSIAHSLGCYGIRPYPGMTADIYMSGMTVSPPPAKCAALPLPSPDIFARTSGEKRIGDCFLWEIPLHKCMLLWNVYSFYKSPGPIRLFLMILKWRCFIYEQEELEIHISRRQSRYSYLKPAKLKKGEAKKKNIDKKASYSSCDDDLFESVSIFSAGWECTSEKPEDTQSDPNSNSTPDNASRGCFLYE